jgi:hypothetical protein
VPQLVDILHDRADTMDWQPLETTARRPWTLSLVLFLFAILGYIVYQRTISPLSKIRGPFWASLTPLWKLFAFNNGNFHETILALHDKYGRIVRIAPSEVIISDRTAIRELYNTTNGRDSLKVRIHGQWLF